ncbi:DUF1648 domain-containing protein [Brevibacillus sp. SYP-B805]|uniref:SdpI family protein n=1 Tax=Brevibacillus sp. SYP-B805 TaxID=1578199 RepID=UPI0013EE1875|nr:SdpI family protein [Brevibacillus sp. SYP-B805]NGQ96575.1 DUF1648 domain-containing protein [Brevibacillus sp. SYP-B805]
MNRVLMVIIWLLPMMVGLFTYDKLPETMATHFDFHGEANGYQSKGMFFLTYLLISGLLIVLTNLSRRIDPRKENYPKFEKAFGIIRLLVLFVLSAGFIFVIAVNLGLAVDAVIAAHLLVGVTWLVIGNYLGQVRSNYFIGIRTPWTLASDEVWRKTHRFSGPLWVVVGAIMVISAFVPFLRQTPFLLFALIAASALLPVLYSYVIYRQGSR